MTGKHVPDVAEQLNLHHEGEGVSATEVPRKTAPPRKRRIPRKPSPAQIEQFEALRARVMGKSPLYDKS